MIKSVSAHKQTFAYTGILLRQLVKTDFKLRYQGSVLGYVWSLLKPLFLFAILYVVFVEIVGVDYGVGHDGVYLLLGIVLWSFFAELTGGSVTSVVSKGDLLRKLNFPKYVIILSVAFSALINLALNMAVVVVFMFLSGVEFGPRILFAPLLLVELALFSLGISFFLSTVYVKLRDIGHIWEVAMQALFYMTPILFPLSFAAEWIQKILVLSPLAQIIQDLRYVLISSKTTVITDVYDGNLAIRAIPIAIVIVAFAGGAVYFTKKSKHFAEEI